MAGDMARSRRSATRGQATENDVAKTAVRVVRGLDASPTPETPSAEGVRKASAVDEVLKGDRGDRMRRCVCRRVC